jgi:hypothetical protein
VVAFGLGCASFALGLAMRGVEMCLKIGPGLVGCGLVEPGVAIIEADSRVIDGGVGSIYNLLFCESPVSGLGVRLDLFNSAE